MEKKQTVTKRSFFDCMKVIVNSKDKHQMELDIKEPTFRSFYSKFMVQRYISMDNGYLDIIKEHQQVLEAMDNESHYRLLFAVIPQKRNFYIKYISKGKAKKKAKNKG